MRIRKAEREDIQPMLDIYNYEVEFGTATMDVKPKTFEEWELWFGAHNIENHPLIVAEVDGKTVGYASLSRYREKEAYNTTVELSVYVNRAYRRKSVGSELMKEIIRMAREDSDTHAIVSVIMCCNEASINLHTKFGFESCGLIREAAKKFGKYLDVCHYILYV